jgi:hypothetical protein
MPRPVYHDELSYLLAADTFARGRVTNPTHPRWPHFESFHVLQHPSYASKYPPGQGLLLALGQRLGAPIAGVWLGVFAMCAAVTWMLGGFVPARWALFGGVLCAAQIAVFTYWGQGYWGGALAATGGALVFGATARIASRGRAVAPKHLSLRGFVLGLGLLILASTRPVEGALVSLAAAGSLLVWLARPGDRARRAMWVAAPVGVVLAIGLGATLLYNRAITGDALHAPYTVHDQAYLATPAFVFQPLRPIPRYRHDLFRRFYVDYLVGAYQAQRSVSGWASVRADRLARSWQVLLGPVLTASLLLALGCRRARGVRLAVAGTSLLLVAVAVTTSHHPHYAAPAVPLLLLAAVQGTRSLVLRFPSTRRRRGFAIAIVLAAVAAARLAIPDPVLAIGRARSANRAKATVERELEKLGGRHVVFVRHGPYADIHDEWVANGADIDARQVVFARAMSPAEDAALRAYYADRRAWRVAIAIDRPGVIDFAEIAPAGESESRQRNSAAQRP